MQLSEFVSVDLKLSLDLFAAASMFLLMKNQYEARRIDKERKKKWSVLFDKIEFLIHEREEKRE